MLKQRYGSSPLPDTSNKHARAPCRIWHVSGTGPKVDGLFLSVCAGQAPFRDGGRYWDRTSDLFRVREARYRCANRPGVPNRHPARWRRDLNPCRRLCRPLPRLSATPPYEACGLKKPQSGQPDSNRRPQPWQGCALPTELCPHLPQQRSCGVRKISPVQQCLPNRHARQLGGPDTRSSWGCSTGVSGRRSDSSVRLASHHSLALDTGPR